MKNILIILLLTAIGTTLVSCDKKENSKKQKYSCNIPDKWNPDINPRYCPVMVRKLTVIEYDTKKWTYTYSYMNYCDYLNSIYYSTYGEDYGLFLAAADDFDSIITGHNKDILIQWGYNCGENNRDTSFYLSIP